MITIVTAATMQGIAEMKPIFRSLAVVTDLIIDGSQ